MKFYLFFVKFSTHLAQPQRRVKGYKTKVALPMTSPFVPPAIKIRSIVPTFASPAHEILLIFH
jgi:hypothetical protein